MKKKTRIGVPRAFLYYRYYILWKTFFEGLGCKVILSPVTNNDIIDRGSDFFNYESCLPSKIYLGHVFFLCDRCDYVLVPNVCNYGKEKKVCNKFNVVYKIISNTFSNIISYDINNMKFKHEFFGFIRMGFKINKNILKIIYYYFVGKKKNNGYSLSLIRNQENILKSIKPKILIVAYPYVIYDDYIYNSIIKYLRDNNIQILYSDRLDRREAAVYSNDFLNIPSCVYSREIIGSISYYKFLVDGIIFLSSFSCEFSPSINELIIHNDNKIPSINISIEHLLSNNDICDKMNRFINVVKIRYNNR